MAKKPSLFGTERVCYVCQSPYVQLHHIFPSSRRPISDREGATVLLCREHHQGNQGVHGGNHDLDIELRRECQRRWMERENATVDDFIRVFYANYLDEQREGADPE